MDAKEIYDIRVALHKGQHTNYNSEVDLGIMIDMTKSYAAAEEANKMYQKFRAEEIAKQIKLAESKSAALQKKDCSPSNNGNHKTSAIGTNGGKSLDNIAASSTNQ